MRLTIALLALLGCSPPEAPAEPVEPSIALPSARYQPDPEDLDCGVNCEPGASIACEGGAMAVCAPSGLAYGRCGASDWAPAPSACPAGTACGRRSPGGNLGCRSICAEATLAEGEECSGVAVQCQAATPTRAEAAGCSSLAEGRYCCPDLALIWPR